MVQSQQAEEMGVCDFVEREKSTDINRHARHGQACSHVIKSIRVNILKQRFDFQHFAINSKKQARASSSMTTA